MRFQLIPTKGSCKEHRANGRRADKQLGDQFGMYVEPCNARIAGAQQACERQTLFPCQQKYEDQKIQFEVDR